MTFTFEKGKKVRVIRPAHAYTHMGYTDPGCIIPETRDEMTITRISNTKNGRKVHFRRDDNTGYAIHVDKATAFIYEAI